MKPLANKKLLGLSIGEKSFLVAEVAGGEKPRVLRLAEMNYPEGVTLSQPAELGAALATFLKEQDFGSRTAVIGIPVRWIAVKPKEVPPADTRTLVPLLRLQAEAEFSTELKDLVYDFVNAPSEHEDTASVLLLATPRKYLDFVDQLCDAARLRPVSVMPSALALGDATGSEPNKSVMVLAVGRGGSELTVQRGGAAGAIRALRGADVQPAFVSELRRAVSSVPASPSGREIVLWDSAGLDAASLGQQLGVSVRSPELSSLGVDVSETGSNGDGSRFAPAVALAMSAMLETGCPVDFMHSRLAPPKEQLIPRWAVYAGIAAIICIGLGVWAYISLQNLQDAASKLQDQLNSHSAEIKTDQDFQAQVQTAERWHGGDPRYLACWRDIDNAMPGDPSSYITSIDLKEARAAGNAQGGANVSKTNDARALSGRIDGRTAAEQNVDTFVNRLRNSPTRAFSDVKAGQTTLNPRAREYTWSITFTYTPGKNTP